jgi:hypothetical protein
VRDAPFRLGGLGTEQSEIYVVAQRRGAGLSGQEKTFADHVRAFSVLGFDSYFHTNA